MPISQYTEVKVNCKKLFKFSCFFYIIHVMEYFILKVDDTGALLPVLCEIWELSVRATHHFLSEDDIVFFRSRLPVYFNAVDLVKVIDESGRVLGFMGTSEDEIEMLFIHPDFQGKGIGGMLIGHAVNSLGKTKVTVNEQNERALRFYEKCGFVVTGRSEKDSSGKDFPLLHMELGL